MKNFCVPVSLFLNVLCCSAQDLEGTVSQDKGSSPGYVLFAPLNSKTTYLIDKCGNKVHSWVSTHKPAQSVYLLPDGSLLRPGNDTLSHEISAVGGIIERFDWNNNLLWSYTILNSEERQHHDIYPMPNGNVLAIVYKKRSKAEAIAAGRKPSDEEPYVLSEKIVEIKPVGRDSGTVVWQWDVWDHLVQEANPNLPYYGVVAQNPRLININYIPTPGPDWLHFNSLAYNADLDQIMISNHEFSEIFIIDHSTTTAQAATHRGGKSGKGGDLLYRWGNPAAYNTGADSDQTLFRQHSAHWIGKGLPDEGKIILFNNGQGRPGTFYSKVEILDPPLDKKGSYIMTPGKSWSPSATFWNYADPDPACFYSKNISGAQRLANGNTIICAGQLGKFFEIDAKKKTVWIFINHAGMPVTEDEGSKRGEQVFRCTFYEPGYGAFTGRRIKPCPVSEINPGAFRCLPK